MAEQGHGGLNPGSFLEAVFTAAAQKTLTSESALRLIFLSRKAGDKGYAWWTRAKLAAHWEVHKTTITRDYEQWAERGLVKLRPNPLKASAKLIIFPWSKVWDDAVWEKAFRLLVNRSVTWADWNEELLALELQEIQESDFDLSLTGFDPGEIDALLALDDDEKANAAPPLPESPVSRSGDLWLLGKHRVLCGDATSTEAVARLLGDRKPRLMVTDPPYGIELDSEWRDKAGLNGLGPAEPSYMKKRTVGHTETSISGDTRADWSGAFQLVPSLEAAYVWHASKFTREVLDGLLRIGFVHHQQIIWNKGRTVLTRTLYWFAHEPCWFVRKKNAPWYGKAGQNSTIWDSPSPKFVMGSSDEDKYDHPTQKPIELMRKPILNHLRRGELVYDPFLGSGTTLAAAELTERVCYGLELDPKYVDVVVQRWQQLTAKKATLDGDGRTFDEVTAERREVAK